jgi:hypothetical protein
LRELLPKQNEQHDYRFLLQKGIQQEKKLKQQLQWHLLTHSILQACLLTLQVYLEVRFQTFV